MTDSCLMISGEAGIWARRARMRVLLHRDGREAEMSPAKRTQNETAMYIEIRIVLETKTKVATVEETETATKTNPEIGGSDHTPDQDPGHARRDDGRGITPTSEIRETETTIDAETALELETGSRGIGKCRMMISSTLKFDCRTTPCEGSMAAHARQPRTAPL